ncbi:DNA-directed RNA polymerase III subunit RPC5-like [Hydractinia symbiolongicarpus]|uniref:DNA-directed RNA polymerase III subunit RPC5-like n=1 Tax=Hydractinia symbiolongicarpus TaxID=13093 RepID=UPI002551832B|nr:DNA-directed RNA polymerase III subunit RPC5-like [Hydractinia symbiolongicarpus]
MAPASSEDDDMEDKVVHEIDMCLAKGLAEKLFLFQYPVRPASMTYDQTKHLAARMKPTQQKVELELGMDISSPTYYFTRGEQIAHAVDRCDQGSNQKPMFSGHVMDRHVLSSVCATEDHHKYAAAIYRKGVLHITPVKGIVQLRPGFHYFDKAEENNKKAAEALISAEQESQSEDEHADAKPIQLRFANMHQNKRAKNDADKQKLNKAAAEEKWIDMQFFQPDDRRAQMEENLLYCHQDDFESPEFTVTSRDYLKILAPVEKEDASSPADLPHGVLSLLKLKNMELTDQIKALLITAKVLQFTQLCTLLGGGLDENVVLKGLTQYALLVQGCWVVKSEVLYPRESKSQVSGLAAEKLWPSRDYLMFCFNRKRVLSRKEVSSTTRLPTEEMREVLEQIGRQRPAQGWEFMLNTDVDFVQKHPDVSASQFVVWRNKYKTLCTQLHINDEFSSTGEIKDSDLPGLFPPVHRKPSTPRRRTSNIVPLDESPKESGKKVQTKKKSSNETVSGVQIKEENISPVKQIETQELDIKPSVREGKIADEEKPSAANIKTKRKSKAIKNITEELLEADEKKSYAREVKVAKTENLRSGGDAEIVIEDIEKPCNEIVVDVESPVRMNTSDNHTAEEIFIPPVAARARIVVKEEKPPSDIFVKELKKFCRDAIRGGALCLSEIKELLSLRQQETGNILCTGVTDDLLVRCILETGAMEVHTKWDESLDIPEERKRVFLYKSMGEANDKYRGVVIDMFNESLSLRRKDIFEKFTSKLNESPSNHGYSKLMTEFCENHNGQWYLNGTYQTLQKFPPGSD